MDNSPARRNVYVASVHTALRRRSQNSSLIGRSQCSSSIGQFRSYKKLISTPRSITSFTPSSDGRQAPSNPTELDNTIYTYYSQARVMVGIGNAKLKFEIIRNIKYKFNFTLQLLPKTV